MRGRFWTMLSALVLISAPGMSLAGECAGKLEKVGLNTVILKAMNNHRMVFYVDSGHRVMAAPFIGKLVTVQFRQKDGRRKALLFRPARFR
jgi:hypothetical protein